jgi:hypothetical protein
MWVISLPLHEPVFRTPSDSGVPEFKTEPGREYIVEPVR